MIFRMKKTPGKMKEAFLQAAAQFLECEQLNKAVICLQNSREKELVAPLFEKMNQVMCTLHLLFSATWSSSRLQLIIRSIYIYHMK